MINRNEVQVSDVQKFIIAKVLLVSYSIHSSTKQMLMTNKIADAETFN